MVDVLVDGSLFSRDIESAIQMQETRGYEFKSIGAHEPFDNVARFEKIPLGQLPNSLRVVLKGVDLPGHIKISEEASNIYVNRELVAVELWRSV